LLQDLSRQLHAIDVTQESKGLVELGSQTPESNSETPQANSLHFTQERFEYWKQLGNIMRQVSETFDVFAIRQTLCLRVIEARSLTFEEICPAGLKKKSVGPAYSPKIARVGVILVDSKVKI
jgi:hypothetical protein